MPRTLLLLAALVATASVLTVVSFAAPVRHQLALSFTRQPTQYTELYFTHLPRTHDHLVRAGFRIANHYDHAIRYDFTIRVSDGTHAAVIRRGRKLIASGHAATLALHAQVPTALVGGTATITLAGAHGEDIHARMVPSGAR
jgi:hypothetical protein